jgi:hypothetical protein
MFMRNGKPSLPMKGKQVMSRQISKERKMRSKLSTSHMGEMSPKLAASVKKNAEPKPHWEGERRFRMSDSLLASHKTRKSRLRQHTNKTH